MYKTVTISFIGFFTLLLLQTYWLSNLYDIHKMQCEKIIEEQLKISINKEVTIRREWGNIQNPQNPKIIIKSAQSMTQEEIASHKGDTIILNDAEKNNIGNSISDIFTQRIQDFLIKNSPIQLQILDSIFNEQLKGSTILTTTQLILYDKNKNKIDSTSNTINKNYYLESNFYPIGTQGLFYVKAFVELPPHQLLKQMLYALVASFLMTIIIIYCLYYQLIVIRNTRKKLQQQQQTMYTAVHDLKAPLNATYSILDFIALKETDNSRKSLLLTGKVQIRKLTDIIESILNIRKAKQNVDIKKTQVSLPELIEDTMREIALLFPGKKYQFELDNPVPIHYIYTDPVRLERCLRNLLDNALKYSDDDVKVKVSLDEHDNRLSIAIQDNGWGIPLKTQRKLGKQFYRVRIKGKDVPPGYGLGLCSVKQLVKEMGGSFTFQSTEGAGSVFVITLP